MCFETAVPPNLTVRRHAQRAVSRGMAATASVRQPELIVLKRLE